jgi:hypothetical protein
LPFHVSTVELRTEFGNAAVLTRSTSGYLQARVEIVNMLPGQDRQQRPAGDPVRNRDRWAWSQFRLTTVIVIWTSVVAIECALAQEQPSPADSIVPQREDSAGSTLVPLPVIFYQPETNFGFGATAIYLFQLGDPPQNPAAQATPSMVSAVFIYTTKKQIIAAIGTELYPGGGSYRIRGEAAAIKFPTKYWGIGNDSPESAEEDFTPRTFALSAEAQRRFAPGWYAGFTFQIAHRALLEVEEGGLIDTGAAPGAEDGRIIGLGALLTRDTRSSTVFPTSGSYHQLQASLYDGLFGSRYDFGTITLDLRKYFTALPSHVVALRALGVAFPGSPPFDYMPQLGGDVLLRGYFAGRYRDRDLLAFQAEYRAPVVWKIGVVGFAAAGHVAHNLSGFRISDFHPSLGLGLRFKLAEDEGLNLRADYGWGFDVSEGGFYLSLGEAF